MDKKKQKKKDPFKVKSGRSLKAKNRAKPVVGNLKNLKNAKAKPLNLNQIPDDLKDKLHGIDKPKETLSHQNRAEYANLNVTPKHLFELYEQQTCQEIREKDALDKLGEMSCK